MTNRFLIIVSMVVSLMACNNREETSPYEELLSNPPYTSLTDSIHHNPKNPELYFNRGLLLIKNNVPGAALADFRKAWDLDKKEPYAAAISFVLLSKPDSSISFTRAALKEFPKSIDLQLNLAQAYINIGKTDEALKICDEIISQQPNQLAALKLKSELQKNSEDFEGAINSLEQAHSVAPLDEEVAFKLAFLYAQTKNQKVLSLCDSIIARNSKKPEPYYFTGLYYENIRQDDKAIHYFDQAIEKDYNYLEAYMDKGEIFYNQKKYNEAIKTFELVLKISTTYADGYFWLGKCQEALGQKDEARLNYQRAYGLDKSFTEAKEAAERLKQ